MKKTFHSSHVIVELILLCFTIRLKTDSFIPFFSLRNFALVFEFLEALGTLEESEKFEKDSFTKYFYTISLKTRLKQFILIEDLEYAYVRTCRN